MFIPFLVFIIIVLAFWLFAEVKLGQRARITSGLIAIVFTGFLVNAFCRVKPFYESEWHRNSIRDATILLRQGQTNTVVRAFETYTSIAATDSTFRASERMARDLRNAQNN